MIVANETDCLIRSLGSIRPYVDKIYVAFNGTNPETRKILENYNCEIHDYKWTAHFADARNFIFDKIDTDLVGWIDADDELLDGDKLRATCDKAFASDFIGALWTKWYYDHDKAGNCTMILWRERIVRKGWFEWKGRLHETLLQKVNCQHITTDCMAIKHNASTKQINDSAVRNLRIIYDQYVKEHEAKDIDAKTVFDLARSLDATGRREEALITYQEYIPISGWDEDKYTAYFRIADCYRWVGEWNKALEADLLAQKLRPLLPDAYLGLAATNYQMDKQEECVHYIELAFRCKSPMGIMPCDPMKYQAQPLLLLHKALFQLGRAKEALTTTQKALEFYPDSEELKEWLGIYQKFIKQQEAEHALLYIANELKEGKQEDKLKHLVSAIPDYVKDHPVFVRMRNEYNPQIAKNRIVIFCGPTKEMWSPASVATGIGGSEEAVINIADCFNTLGYKVDVFNHCDQPGNYDGVEYKNYWEYDRTVPCDIFIVWRQSNNIKIAPKDSRVWLWCHDIQKSEYFNPGMIERVEKILMLSKFHRGNLPEIPDSKFYITKNGILTEQFDHDVPKDPNRCIFVSSPDRGLLTLLNMWPEIKKEVPAATLHVYYGFTKTYDALWVDDNNMQLYKQQCMDLMKQDGITYHGRIGHKELAREILISSLWLYPTQFTEISCISAIKCQAGKTLPIYTEVAALTETVKFGVPLPYQDIYLNDKAQKLFIDKAIFYLKCPEEREMVMKDAPAWVKENYTWMGIAKAWKKDLFDGKDTNRESGDISDPS